MTVKAYIHSLKDHEHNRRVLGEAAIIKSIGNNLYLAEYNGVHCTAIRSFTPSLPGGSAAAWRCRS